MRDLREPLPPDAKAWKADFEDVFFRSPQGIRVFARILDELGFWDPIDPQDIGRTACRNYAVYLLELTGIDTTGNIENAVRAMVESRLPEKKPNSDG